MGQPGAARAVASACAANALAVAIPCHRVVRGMARCRATAGAWRASGTCWRGRRRATEAWPPSCLGKQGLEPSHKQRRGHVPCPARIASPSSPATVSARKRCRRACACWMPPPAASAST
ncbi:MGMT family protein [Pseudoroseomonas wenyumeiae]